MCESEKSSIYPEEKCVFGFYVETSTKINCFVTFLYRRYLCVCVRVCVCVKRKIVYNKLKGVINRNNIIRPPAYAY